MKEKVMYGHQCKAGGFSLGSDDECETTCADCTTWAKHCEYVCEYCFEPVCDKCKDGHAKGEGKEHPDTLQLPGDKKTMEAITAVKIKAKDWVKKPFTPTLHGGLVNTYTELLKVRITGIDKHTHQVETVVVDAAVATGIDTVLKGILASKKPAWVESFAWTEVPASADDVPIFHYSAAPEVRIVGNLNLSTLPKVFTPRRKYRRLLASNFLIAGANLALRTAPDVEAKVVEAAGPQVSSSDEDVLRSLRHLQEVLGSGDDPSWWKKVESEAVHTLFAAGYASALSFTPKEIEAELSMWV